ncbi:MAG TPA: hypothetical protein VFR09_06320 [Alphaproteobacteria bacterium]|nr:hypothetical protein [Alphaproteobacteria bacterium]
MGLCRFIIAAILITGLTGPALAATASAQKPLGTFGAWQTYSYNEGGQPVCYMVKAAKIPAPKNKKFRRGPAFLMITHRPSENSTDVVSYTAGYNLKPSSDVKVTIGRASFDLFSQKDAAWSRDAHTDHLLATAIRSNTNMKIVGIPAQNVSAITDTLDIKGAAQAYQAIGKACGLEQETPAKPALKAVPASKKKAIKH